MDPIILRLEQIQGYPFSEEQMRILESKGGLSIVAAAGSGKTSTIINLVAKRIMTGEIHDYTKLLCCTYSNGGADELTGRLNKLLLSAGMNINVTVKTMHASYMQILRTFGYNIRSEQILKEGRKKAIIRDICKGMKIKLEDEDLDDLCNIISVQVNELLSDDDLINSPKFTLDCIDKAQYIEIRNSFASIKSQMNMIDFDDMQLMVYNWLCVNKFPQVIEYCHNTWEYFYVDEFQDTNKIQFSILQAMLTDPNKLVVIGDDDQSIYEWRGANPDIILDICGYYPIQKFILSTNYRCGENIVKHAALCVDKMSRRENKEMKSFRKNGVVKLVNTLNYRVDNKAVPELFRMSAYVADEIIKLLADSSNGISAKDICVMARHNANLCILKAILMQNGIRCDSAEGMKITNNSIYNDIVKVIKLSDDYVSGIVIKEIGWKMISHLGVQGANMIEEVMQVTNGLKQALECVIGLKYNDAEARGKISGLSNKAIASIEYKVNRLSMDSLSGIRELINVLSYEDRTKKVIKLLEMYNSGVSFMFKSGDGSRRLAGICAYIRHLIETSGIDMALQTMRMIEQMENSGGKGLGDGSNMVKLSTIHGSKGKEWDTVFILADDNATFPNFEYLLKCEERGVKEDDILRYIDSERRLHYVAQTRAKNNLLFVCELKKASVFILEAFDVFKKCAGAKNNQFILQMARDDKARRLDDKMIEALRQSADIVEFEAPNKEENEQKKDSKSANSMWDNNDLWGNCNDIPMD